VPVLKDGIAYCETARDYGSRDLLDKILRNEEEHIDFLETQFDLISQMGIQNYVQLQSKPNASQALDK
jgi:bacterioferritin